jgi:hypothetical protein
MGPNPDLARKIEIARPPIDKSSAGPRLPATIFKGLIGRAARLDRTRICEFSEFKVAEQTYGADHLDLVLANCYVSKRSTAVSLFPRSHGLGGNGTQSATDVMRINAADGSFASALAS